MSTENEHKNALASRPGVALCDAAGCRRRTPESTLEMMRKTIILAALFALATLAGCHERGWAPSGRVKVDLRPRRAVIGGRKSQVGHLVPYPDRHFHAGWPRAGRAAGPGFYALDLQDDRAIRQAALVQRAPGEAPGWEFVAAGIAQMNQHAPQKAIATLQHGIAAQGPQSPIASAAMQWLALAQLLAGEDDRPIDTLQTLANSATSRFDCHIMVDPHSRSSRPPEAGLPEPGALCRAIGHRVGKLAAQRGLVGADDQTLYDAAIAATAQGDLDTAGRLFASVQQESDGGGDVAVWIAMITAARGDWLTSRKAGSMKPARRARPLRASASPISSSA